MLPQALRNVYPAVVNQLVQIILGSSLLSAISVPELTGTAMVINARTLLTVQVFAIAAVLYLDSHQRRSTGGRSLSGASPSSRRCRVSVRSPGRRTPAAARACRPEANRRRRDGLVTHLDEPRPVRRRFVGDRSPSRSRRSPPGPRSAYWLPRYAPAVFPSWLRPRASTSRCSAAPRCSSRCCSSTSALPISSLAGISVFGAALLALTLYHGAYIAEIFRAGIEAVPRASGRPLGSWG